MTRKLAISLVAAVLSLACGSPRALGQARDFSPRPEEQQVPKAMHSAMEQLPRITVGQTKGDLVGNDNRVLQAAVDYIAGLGAAMNAGWAPAARIKQAADLYRGAWERNKDTPLRAQRPGEVVIGSVRMLVIAETDAEAEKLAQPAYERWYKSLEHQANSFGFTAMFVPGAYEVARRRIGSVIAGSPETVRSELLRHIAESSVNYPLIQLTFGNLTDAQTKRTLTLFANEILPQLRKL